MYQVILTYAITFNIAIDQTLKLGTWLLNFHEKRSTEGQKYQTKIVIASVGVIIDFSFLICSM